VAADYSQIELRIMAHLSGDDGLLEAFRENLDVHSATAAEVFGVALGFRVRGAAAQGQGDQLRTDLRHVRLRPGAAAAPRPRRGAAYIDVYFERYPGVREYMERTRALAHEQGYVETLFGRRLYLPEINARNKMRQQAAERTAINAPMQGTAADIIKRAMLDVDAWLRPSAVDARMIMQVHDELVLEVEDQLDRARRAWPWWARLALLAVAPWWLLQRSGARARGRTRPTLPDADTGARGVGPSATCRAARGALHRHHRAGGHRLRPRQRRLWRAADAGDHRQRRRLLRLRPRWRSGPVPGQLARMAGHQSEDAAGAAQRPLSQRRQRPIRRCHREAGLALTTYGMGVAVGDSTATAGMICT
jgi:hypothetical protein